MGTELSSTDASGDPNEETISLGVYGSKQTGKTTLINRMLRKDLDPSYTQTCTPCTTGLRWFSVFDPSISVKISVTEVINTTSESFDGYAVVYNSNCQQSVDFARAFDRSDAPLIFIANYSDCGGEKVHLNQKVNHLHINCSALTEQNTHFAAEWIDLVILSHRKNLQKRTLSNLTDDLRSLYESIKCEVAAMEAPTDSLGIPTIKKQKSLVLESIRPKLFDSETSDDFECV